MPGYDEHGHPYHFRVLGFPVHVGWDFFLWPVLIASRLGAVGLVSFVGVMFVSVLFHELGHAVAFRAFGSPAAIRLWGLGGLTSGQQPDRRWQDVVVSAAGPLPPLLLIGLPSFVAWNAGVGIGNEWAEAILYFLWWINLVWSVINLVPILPMDGGRLFETLFGLGPARIASVLSGLALAALVWSLGWSPTSVILAVAVAGYNAYKFAEERRSGAHADPVREWNRQERADARAQRAAPRTADDGWTALADGDLAAARTVTTSLGVQAPLLLTGTLLAAEGRTDDARNWFVAGLLDDGPVPPVADSVLAHAGLAVPVADGLAASGDVRAPAALDRLLDRLTDRGHVGAAGGVADIRAAAAGEGDAGPRWYDAARTWARSGDVDRVAAALHQSAVRGHAGAAMVTGDPAFSRLFDDPRFPSVVASLDPPPT